MRVQCKRVLEGVAADREVEDYDAADRDVARDATDPDAIE